MPEFDPREDFNSLLHRAVELAAGKLGESGEFDPFALTLRADGSVAELPPPSPKAGEDMDRIVAKLRKALESKRAEYRAIAICADVTIEEEESETTALQIAMEHAHDDPAICYVPYRIVEKRVEFAEPVGEPGERNVFPAPPH